MGAGRGVALGAPPPPEGGKKPSPKRVNLQERTWRQPHAVIVVECYCYIIIIIVDPPGPTPLQKVAPHHSESIGIAKVSIFS